MTIQSLNKGIFASLCIAMALCTGSCSNRPDGVLSDDKTVDLLADMYIADAYTSQNEGEFPTDSAKKGFRQSILMRHGISQKELDRTLDWYGMHFDQYVALYEKIDKKIAERAKKYKKNRSSLEEKGEVNNLWTHSRVLRLSPVTMRDGVAFEIDKSELKKGNRLIWNFRLVNYDSNIQAFIAAEYDNNFTRSLNRDISEAGKIEIEFVTDSSRMPKRIYGYLRLKGSTTVPAWIDSISMTAANFDAKKYHKIEMQTVFSPTDKKKQPTVEVPQKVNQGNVINPNMEDDGTSMPASLGRSHARRLRQANPNLSK